MAAKWSGSVGRLQQYTNLHCINLPHAHVHKSKLTEVVTINFMVLQFKLDIANINKRQKWYSGYSEQRALAKRPLYGLAL